jgi:hypothetical protein
MGAATGADTFQDVCAFSSFSALLHVQPMLTQDEQMAEVCTDILASTELGPVTYNSSSPDTSSTINNDIDADTSTDTSTNTTPVRSGTPTGAILVLG